MIHQYINTSTAATTATVLRSPHFLRRCRKPGAHACGWFVAATVVDAVDDGGDDESNDDGSTDGDGGSCVCVCVLCVCAIACGFCSLLLYI